MFRRIWYDKYRVYWFRKRRCARNFAGFWKGIVFRVCGMKQVLNVLAINGWFVIL